MYEDWSFLLFLQIKYKLNMKAYTEDQVKYESCSDGTRRRITLPATVNQRKSSENAFVAFLRRLAGMELTRVGFPVSCFEPNNWLQKQAEQMMYVDKLRIANDTVCPAERMAIVTGVCISSLLMYINSDRSMAFNPILGETFETCRSDYGYRIMLEQVSHHPPVLAFLLESVDTEGKPDGIYRVFGNAKATASFCGTSVVASPEGFTTYELIQKNESYTMTSPEKIIVSNLLRGMERFRHRMDGKLRLTRTIMVDGGKANADDMLEACLTFHPPLSMSWLGNWDEAVDPPWLDGFIENSLGERLLCFYGKYNSELYSVPVDVWEQSGGWRKLLVSSRKTRKIKADEKSSVDQSVLAFLTADGESLFDFQLQNQKLLWRRAPLPASCADYYKMTKFAIQLNEFTPDLAPLLPPTDSRFRKDMQALEIGNLDLAEKEKFRIEEKQRADLRLRISKGSEKPGESDPWSPLWFRKGDHPFQNEIGTCWLFTGEYYNRNWSMCPDLSFNVEN